MTPAEKREAEIAAWRAAQLAAAPPLTQEQQRNLRRILLSRRTA